MSDPVFRRIACDAVVYWEMDPAGPRVARLIVDCPLPLLEGVAAEQIEELEAATAALERWLDRHPAPAAPPDPAPPASQPVVIETAQWEASA
jgi:hypothetical protein